MEPRKSLSVGATTAVKAGGFPRELHVRGTAVETNAILLIAYGVHGTAVDLCAPCNS